MSDHKALREAFVAGANWAAGYRSVGINYDEAELRYPAPKVERPRVVTVEGTEYRVVNGMLEWEHYGGNWLKTKRTRADYMALLDLFDHPTELVEADE